MYAALDVFFLVFHTGWVVFNLVGWMWKKTRRANLVTLLLTGGSWVGLGMWYGYGYCPCTDWHWQVRRAMGDDDLPRSYMKFLVDVLTGLDVGAALVDAVTVIGFVTALSVSAVLNGRDRKAGAGSG